ncbi:MAG: Hsp20/alpha crystallin family protein [Vicinamibacterales bacterium]
MRSRIQAVVLPSEIGEFADEVRRIFREIGPSVSPDTFAGECVPPVDVYETDEALEIAIDLPGVDATGVRVVIKGGALLVAGEKTPRRGRGDSSFHLVERGFGRFARLIRLTAACDAGRAGAVLRNGELRITVPKLPERRGVAIQVPVTTGQSVA